MKKNMKEAYNLIEKICIKEYEDICLSEADKQILLSAGEFIVDDFDSEMIDYRIHFGEMGSVEVYGSSVFDEKCEEYDFFIDTYNKFRFFDIEGAEITKKEFFNNKYRGNYEGDCKWT